MGVSENIGVPYFGVLIIRNLLIRDSWGPYNKEPTNWGIILGFPIFGNSHLQVQVQEPGVQDATRKLMQVPRPR